MAHLPCLHTGLTRAQGPEGCCALPQILREHLEANLCANLSVHTATDVQTAEHVSVLFKDSFLAQFEPKAREFMKEFVETQMFSVYTDTSLK